MTKKYMIIGRMGDRHHATLLAEGMMMLHPEEVVRIATDYTDLLPEGSYDHSAVMDFYHRTGCTRELYAITTGLRKIILKPYIDMYPDLEWILIVQNQNQTFDVEGCNLPKHYYHTTKRWAALPRGDFCQGLFYAYPNGSEKIKDANPFEEQYLWFREFLPHFADIPPLRGKFDDRPTLISFTGGISCNTNNTEEQQIYGTRAEYLKEFLKFSEHRNGFVWHEETTYQKYIESLQMSKAVINIMGEHCHLNLRAFEAMANGCVLLQQYDPVYEQLGLKHEDQLIYFHNFNELNEIASRLETLDLKPIADRGRKWVEKYASKYARVRDIFTRIAILNDRDKDRAENLERHKHILDCYQTKNYEGIQRLWNV